MEQQLLFHPKIIACLFNRAVLLCIIKASQVISNVECRLLQFTNRGVDDSSIQGWVAIEEWVD
jgi:hypothetical protein